MQVPASTVRNHYQRAKRELRAALAGERNPSSCAAPVLPSSRS
ncbi:hypothetical protein [Xylanimonas protaetiae]|nr:hypothetical protein [Xylanimonas protaetiae]